MRTPITIAQERQLLSLPTLRARKDFLRKLRDEKGLSFASPTTLEVVSSAEEVKKTNLIAEHFCFGPRVHLFSMR